MTNIKTERLAQFENSANSRWADAERDCTEALKLQPNNPKARSSHVKVNVRRYGGEELREHGWGN